MAFGYTQLYANGLNSNTQLRRSVDMIYQRGGTYEVVLTGDTYVTSMELDIDMFGDDVKVGRMSIVPYDVTQSGATYTYRFNIRPYDYMSNFVKSQHYNKYYLNNWQETNRIINIENPYPNSIRANFKYGYRFLSGSTSIVEYSGSPSNNYNHYTTIPFNLESTGFTASGFTNTGGYFDYIGGTHQMNEKFMLPNFDQELGTVVGTGLTINTVDTYRRYSPASQFLFDYPNVPEMSETSRFLTDAPRIQTIQTNENYVLYYLAGQTGDRQVIEADFLNVEFFTESGVLLDYFYEALNFSGTTYESPTGYTDNLKVFALPCGPVDIENIYKTIDWGSVGYYTVQVCYGSSTNDPTRDSGGPRGPSSEIFYFYLYNNCSNESTRLAWLNDRGGFDYFTFKSFRSDTKKITRQTYQNKYFSTNINSPDRDIGRFTKTYGTSVEREFVLESDYVNEVYGKWLEQLFYSPQVYEVKDDYISPMDRQDVIYKDLRPVQVTTSEVDEINTNHKKLNKYKITLKYSDAFFTNNGF